MLDAIEKLLQSTDPHVVLSQDGQETRIPLLHQANAPATAAAIDALASRLNGCSDALLSLYRKHDGLRLYAKRNDQLSGLLLFPLEEMAAAKDRLSEWLEIDSLCMDEDEDELGPYTTDEGVLAYLGYPDWWEEALVFGILDCTPESLIMPTRGEHAGKIFIYEHDGGDYTSWVADSFEDLIHTLIRDPVQFMQRYYNW